MRRWLPFPELGFTLLFLALLGLAVYLAGSHQLPPPPPSSYSIATAPQVFRNPEVNCAMLAEAVNHFVALGKSAGLAELRGLASIRNSAGEVDGYERFGYVSRILFSPKGSEPLRQPAFGTINLPFDSMPEKGWPVYPLASSGSSYFVLGNYFFRSGVPEDPLQYIDYCEQNGTFRTTKVPVPTRAQAFADAEALRNSPAWKAAKWRWNQEGDTWRAVHRQAELTPP